jgi:hypothetical protein
MRSLVVLILLSMAAAYGQDHRPTLKETLEWMHIAFPVGPDYAERFAKAFRNAVTLCGGKKSAF